MMKRRAILAAGATVLSLVFVSSLCPPAFAAWPGAAGQILVHQSWNNHIVVLDVEGSDSIENVRQKITDKTEIETAVTCLVFDGVVMHDGRTLNDYNVEPNDEFDLFTIPVLGAWSITPDEHFVGNTVHNVPITSPEGTHFVVVDGELPAGVTLDENTGIVDGKFTSADSFDVTIRVTTLCGDADITWASSGGKSLPDTGHSEATLFGGIAIAALLAMVGSALVVIRRRRTRTN